MQEGLGLLDVETVRGLGPRQVGEVTVTTDLDGVETLRGYENHAGITHGRGEDDLGRRRVRKVVTSARRARCGAT